MLNISRRMMNGFGRSLARSAAPSPHGDWSAIQARHPRLISWASSRISPEIVLNTIPNLGYAAENLTLRHARKAFTSRSCHRRTFDDKGLTHISRLALQNCQDLRHVIAWNHANNINFFRISSKLIPWAGKYPLEALPDFPAIADALATAGELARTLGQRITSHPPHFIKLAATNEALQQQSIATLEVQNQVFDLMGFPPSHWNKINIHVGGLYGSKARAIDRFASSFESLSGSLRARLTVENDDRLNSYSVADLLTLNAVTGIPITFDFHHHQFCDGGMTQSEALEAALSTWPRDVRPVVHWSERPECPNLSRTHPHAHSKFVYGPMMLHGREGDVDVMIESKAKEVALLLYRDEIAPKQALAAAAAATAEAFASPDFMQRSSLQAGVA